jgi:hypothetical protein
MELQVEAQHTEVDPTLRDWIGARCEALHKTPSGRTLGTSVYPQGPARGVLDVYVPRLITSPSS